MSVRIDTAATGTTGEEDDDDVALTPAELMQMAEEIYSKYEPEKISLDAWADEFMMVYRINSPDDQSFLRQVFYGSVRYRKLISAFISAFYSKESGNVLRGDRDMYRMYTYLALLRLKELSFPQFRRLVISADPQKMVVWLNFIFNEKTMIECCKDSWLKLYDVQFVDDLITAVMEGYQECKLLIEDLEMIVYMSKKKEEEEAAAFDRFKGTKALTVVKPFPLSESKPRPLPPPEIIPPAPKPKPPPPRAEDGKLTKTQLAIIEAKQENKRKLEAKYSDPNRQPFKLATDLRPMNTDKVRAELEEERSKDARFFAPKARPAPPPPEAEVRLNAAAILREDALYKKKQLQEAQMLKAYEMELRDASEFSEWQSARLAEDEAARKEEIETRRLQNMEAARLASEAQRQQLIRNREKAQELKEASKAQEEQRRKELAALEDANREKREQVLDGKQGSRQAVERAAEERRERAAALREEEALHARALAEQRALEMQRKADLIRQLRAIEKVPVSKDRDWDPTSVAGHELLDEMSVAELKERLAIVKRRDLERQEMQRTDILRAKKDREAKIMAKASNITRIRDLAQAQAEMRRIAKLKALEEKEAARRAAVEKDAVKLHNKLAKVRADNKMERDRLRAEEKAIRFEQEMQAASAALVEETKFRELRRGAEREVRVKQETSLEEATEYEATKAREQGIRRTNVKNNIKGKRDFVRDYDSRVRALGEEDRRMKSEEYERKKSLVETEKSRFETAKGSIHEARNKKSMRRRPDVVLAGSKAGAGGGEEDQGGAAAAAAAGKKAGLEGSLPEANYTGGAPPAAAAAAAAAT